MTFTRTLVAISASEDGAGRPEKPAIIDCQDTEKSNPT